MLLLFFVSEKIDKNFSAVDKYFYSVFNTILLYVSVSLL